MRHALYLCLLLGCGSSSNGSADAPPGGGDGHNDGHNGDGSSAKNRTVLVVPFENKDSVEIYGDTTDAPYLNGLLATSAHATNFMDELALAIPSEPHYIWMEAGTNVFSDRTFTSDADGSTTNSTAETKHLSTQLDTAGLTWTAYQEGITTGACPIGSSGEYAAKHDPFVFFRDVVGSPPSASNARCGQHHKALADLTADLQAGTVANYAFITPNLCDDMHGDSGCASGTGAAANIKAGDTWAAANVPALIQYTHTHDAILLLVWDEGDANRLIPFIAISDHVVTGASTASYTQSSQVKSIEEFLGLPVLPAVSGAADFSPMFAPGYLTGP